MLVDLAAEAPTFASQLLPPVLLWHTGHGGNSKYAKNSLRNNVFAGHHCAMSFECFQDPTEFRQQAGHATHAKA
eukprot:5860428-Lingulodinium_polyedra.AAC.1